MASVLSTHPRSGDILFNLTAEDYDLMARSMQAYREYRYGLISKADWSTKKVKLGNELQALDNRLVTNITVQLNSTARAAAGGASSVTVDRPLVLVPRWKTDKVIQAPNPAIVAEKYGRINAARGTNRYAPTTHFRTMRAFSATFCRHVCPWMTRHEKLQMEYNKTTKRAKYVLPAGQNKPRLVSLRFIESNPVRAKKGPKVTTFGYYNTANGKRVAVTAETTSRIAAMAALGMIPEAGIFTPSGTPFSAASFVRIPRDKLQLASNERISTRTVQTKNGPVTRRAIVKATGGAGIGISTKSVSTYRSQQNNVSNLRGGGRGVVRRGAFSTAPPAQRPAFNVPANAMETL